MPGVLLTLGVVAAETYESVGGVRKGLGLVELDGEKNGELEAEMKADEDGDRT